MTADPTRLYLLRHADAGDPMRWDAADAERPLSDKGIRQAERLGHHLAAIRFESDAIVSSPKVRAAETARIVGEALGLPVAIDPRLAGPFGIDDLGRILGAAGSPRQPVLVGHDPDLSELLAGLVGATDIAMKKGALARVDVRDGLIAGGGSLRWLLPPDAIAG